MSLETFDIEGRTLMMPIEVRRARNWVATYTVPAEPLRRLVEPTELELAQSRPEKGLVTLGFVQYDDTDLGAYHEFMVGIIVRRHDAGPATARQRSREVRRNRVAVYIHRLPVDDAFSMAAGRGIWGYPKTLMTFEGSTDGGATSWSLSDDGRLAVAMRFEKRWFPMPRSAAPPTYTLLDGILRMTTWESRARRVRMRPRGVQLELGQGEIAEELRSLGLPKKALLSISTAEMRATFSSAKVIERQTTTATASVSSEKDSEARAQKH